MNQAILDFSTSIYEEHLSEASFLRAQRVALLGSPETSWKTLSGFEERFEAHVDGLVTGGAAALEICTKAVDGGDAGALYTAISVFCRLGRMDLVDGALENLDEHDLAKVTSVSDALNHYAPDEWTGEWSNRIRVPGRKFVQILVKSLGYRRCDSGAALKDALEQPVEGIPVIIWALGRLRDRQARMALFNKYLQVQGTASQSSASLALMRMGEPQVVQYCMKQAKEEPWARIPLGLGGKSDAVPFLMGLGAAPQASDDIILALGLLGSPAAVELLITHLPDSGRAPAAAMALNLITGADLNEEIVIPDEIREDELFEEEKEALRRGERRENVGQPSEGETVVRVSQKPEEWKRWWMQNRSSFTPSVRYRSGKPYSPACLLESLASEKSPMWVRQMACEEFVIRYGADYPFEADMFVTGQVRAIAQYGQWCRENNSRFTPGKWYFAGRE